MGLKYNQDEVKCLGEIWDSIYLKTKKEYLKEFFFTKNMTKSQAEVWYNKYIYRKLQSNELYYKVINNCITKEKAISLLKDSENYNENSPTVKKILKINENTMQNTEITQNIAIEQSDEQKQEIQEQILEKEYTKTEISEIKKGLVQEIESKEQPKTLQNLSVENTNYEPVSEACDVLDTNIPLSMKYETQQALEQLDREVRGVDNYVAEKLHYSSGAELCKALKAEQVDAVAMCIYNIEKKGKGTIIADQTGIGKGRTGASIIRYAIKAGYKPIFITEKPNLFSDIFRDMIDIGLDDGVAKYIVKERKQVKAKFADWIDMSEEDKEDWESQEEYEQFVFENPFEEKVVYGLNPDYDISLNRAVPFIFNAKTNTTSIKDTNGNVIYEADESDNKNKILDLDFLPEPYKFAILTYSQISSKGKKREFFKNISEDNIIILDESHNASGEGNTGKFLFECLQNSKGVVFLSATYSKRPSNMPIYATKTAISDVNMEMDKIIEAIENGGVALQEVISSQLVREGQLLRRERSFEGIEVNYITLDDKAIEHKAIADSVTFLIRNIIEFQKEYVADVIEKLDDELVKEGGQVDVKKGTKEAGISNAPYFSKVFQVVYQMLFAIKAESIADRAIERLKEGKKPVIAFTSTMGSFLDNMDAKEGDTIKADFSEVVMRGLNGVMRYTETNAQGQQSHSSLHPSQLSTEGQLMYAKIEEAIKKISTGISISPIDIILEKIQAAGFKAEEITGRKMKVKHIGKGMGIVENRAKVNVSDAFRMYNNNEIDCLLINQAGATGASAHAIVTPKVKLEDIKQRVMIILQAELDINKEVQKRGRINRTGQVLKPIYDYVTSAIPAEQRLMMMLQKKLKSLDANTSSNQKQSSKVLDVKDFLNKYGDKVVTEYCLDNEDFTKSIGDPLNLYKDKETEVSVEEIGGQKVTVAANAAHRVSGRVAILPVKEQEKFYNDINLRYEKLIEYLRQADEYDLEVENMNLQAETKDKKVLIVGKGDHLSVFGRDTYIEKVEVNVLKKPFKKEEIDILYLQELQGKTPDEYITDLKNNIDTFTENRVIERIAEIESNYSEKIAAIPNKKAIKAIEDDNERMSEISSQVKELQEELELSKKIAEQKIRKQTGNVKKYLLFFKPQKALYDGVDYILPIGFSVDMKLKNPFAPSSVELKLAFASSKKYIEIPLSKEELLNNMVVYSQGLNLGNRLFENWNDYTKKNSSERETRHIVTGNILQAFATNKAKLISYTLKGGGIKKGILMTKKFSEDTEKLVGFEEIFIPISKLNYDILENTDGETLKFNVCEFYLRYGRIYFSVPSSKKDGGLFLDDVVLKSYLVRNIFEKTGSRMIAEVSTENFNDLLVYLNDVHRFTVKVSSAIYEKYYGKIEIKEYSDEEIDVEKQTIEKLVIDTTPINEKELEKIESEVGVIVPDKEIYEMTKSEFIQFANKSGLAEEMKNRFGYFDYTEYYKEQLVSAINQGIQISNDILKQYPEIENLQSEYLEKQQSELQKQQVIDKQKEVENYLISKYQLIKQRLNW